MLCVLLSLGESVFALPAAGVARIVPKVALRRLALAPAHFAGLLRYRGAAVPVIDLCALALGRPAADLLSTRVVIIDYATRPGETRLLGLLAESVMETVSIDEKDIRSSGVKFEGSAYLGKVANTPQGLVQLIDASGLLTPEVKSQLFPESAAAP